VDVEQVKVPSFFGMSVVQAEKTAAGVGLKVQTQVSGARCPPVAIGGQDPLPGEALPRGGTVVVLIPFPLPNISCGGI
jgi:beta-lactam-binding protein with PASTA domain